MSIADKYKGFIIELDGVMYLDGKLLAHSKSFILKLIKEKKRYVFLTNDSILPGKSYSNILNKLGVPCKNDQVITPIKSFEEVIYKFKKKKVKVIAITSKKIKNYLRDNNRIEVLNPEQNYKNADIVLVAGSNGFNYMDLMYSSLALQNGSKLYATSIDNTYPTKLGNVPATGSIIAAIQKATDSKVENLGKPSRKIFKIASDYLGFRKSDILVIGDNLNTDIYGSSQAGLDSALVLTGKTKLKDVRKSKLPFRPSYTIKNLRSL